jgi:hypothetical protein
MLAYLDSLIAALTVRDGSDIDRLLAHPLARILHQEARREAETFRAGECDPLAAPLRVMQLRHQTAELLRASVVAERASEYLVANTPANAPARVQLSPLSRARSAVKTQMELPLSA